MEGMEHAAEEKLPQKADDAIAINKELYVMGEMIQLHQDFIE